MRRKPVATIERNNATAKRKNAMGQQMSEKQAKKTLEESNVVYHTLFENTGTGMLVIDEDTTILTVNKEFERISSYSKKELEGKRSWTDFVAKDYLEKMKEYHRLRRIDPKAVPRTYETKLIDKQGRVLDALLIVALIPGTKRSIVSLIDITERKKAEKELENLARYTDEDPNPILRLDKNGVILHANEASDPLLKGWKKKIGDYASKYWMDLANEAYSCQSSKNVDVQLGDKTFLFTLIPIENAGYVNIYGRDITDRIMAEQDLRKSGERFAQVAENSGEWIWEVDAKGLYTYSSPAVEKILGYKSEEIVGKKHFYDFFTPEVKHDLTKAAFDSFAKRQMFRTFVNPNLHKNGKVVILETSGTPIVSERGELLGYRGADTDVTERKQMEDELRENEKRFRLLTENLPIGIYSADPDAVSSTTFISGRIYEQTGYSVNEYKNNPDIWNKIIHPDDREFVWKKVEDHRKNKTLLDIEYRIMTRDGTVKWLRDKASPVFGKNGTIVSIDGFTEDVTERKRLEEELKKRTEHLEELVEERTKEIQVLNASIMERLVQKTNQIDTISKLRDRIRTVPDISTGMDLILDAALKDLEMDAGAVLVFDRKEDVADVRAFKSTTEKITLKPSYPGCRLSECEVLRLDQAVSKTEGISCILGTTSVHCAPVHFGREVEGALMLGSQEALTLDESDKTILRMYADLASTLFEIQNLVVTPTSEATRPYRHYELEFGRAYLTKNVEFAFEMFRDNVLGGLEGLCITREYPPKVREKQGLKKTPIIWLSGESAEDEATVNSLQDLSVIINDFLSKAARGIILLDGFEYLIANHGFDSFIRFLQLSRSRVEEKDAILIAPMLEETPELRHARLIAREMSIVESKEKQ